jgi:hypothetical protein
MARRACLAIGVSTVMSSQNKALRFGYLEGAAIAARTIGEWALGSGFGEENVRIVTDEQIDARDNPVTRDRVQQAVDELFPAGAETVEQLILAFCGHGLTDPNFGSISWLFSDSLRLKYRIVADAFYDELLLHGIERITLITDACREAPRELDLMRLDPVRGIAVDGGKVDSPKFDRLAACQDGQLGYMVSEPASAAPGKCIFSGVIADALWGLEPAAIKDGKITTSSFGACVRARTAERARSYRLKLNPQCLVDPEDAVLYDSTRPPQGPPKLQPWPEAAGAAVMGAVLEPESAPSSPDADEALERVRTDEPFRKAVLGRKFGAPSSGFASGRVPIVVPDGSKMLIRELVLLHDTPPRKTRGGNAAWKRRRTDDLIVRLEGEREQAERSKAATGLRRSIVQIKPSVGREGSNLLVSDREAGIWSGGGVEQRRRTSARVGFRIEPDPDGMPVLVELGDGRFAPFVPYSRLYGVVKESPGGVLFQAYGRRDSRDAFRAALKAIADFAAGRLDSASIDELAALMRHGKHADPVLGAISAYLYRSIADFDSIRRMAFFYADRGQPVPFDIALLGDMAVTCDSGRALRLHVPAVRAGPARPRDVRLPRFVTQATGAIEARIGGRCPWVALGWDHVGMARREWEPLVEGLAEHARHVPRTGFTALPRKSGLALARLWGLERQ